MSRRHPKRSTTRHSKKGPFKPLELNSCCKISFDNVLRPTKLDKAIDLPLSPVQASEEERLEISNVTITSREEDSKPIIALSPITPTITDPLNSIKDGPITLSRITRLMLRGVLTMSQFPWI